MRERLYEAFRNLLSYRLRALLTMLGIIFGLVAFITMLAIGSGAKEEILNQISTLGLKNIMVKAKKEIPEQDLLKAKSVSSFGLCHEDLDFLTASYPFIESYSGYLEVEKSLTLNGRKVTDEFKLKAVDQNFFKLISKNFCEGSDFSEFSEFTRGVILPEKLKRKYYGNLPCKGEYVWIEDEIFQITGVTAENPAQKKVKDESTELMGSENEVYFPLELVNHMFPFYGESPPYHRLSGAVIRLTSSDNLAARKDLVSKTLKRRHGGILDVETTAPLELLKKSQKTQEIFNLVMLLIASLSLLIGGIGIMNIMLANVMERTKEIGIHRAVGATRRDIVLNFLFESLVLSSTGGVIGIVLGIITSRLVMLYTGWKVIISFSGIFSGVLVSVCVGVFFGIYPAYRASRVEPIEALRYE
ncbi:MAG: ABC transporter permease [Candidatus Wallbacteria bacterium]|nr:ABC transporter permease [Candidatus Wallbacteria bacterium]